MPAKVRLLAALVAVAALLQATLLPHLRIAGVQADLFLVLVTLTALAYGPREAGWVGLACGLIADLLLGRYLGLFTFTKAAVGILVGYGSGKVYREFLPVPGLAAAAATGLQHLFVLLLFYAAGLALPPQGLTGGLAIAAVYNAALATAGYGRMLRYRQRTAR